MKYLSGMIGAAGGNLGNAGALSETKAGTEVADLFRGMQQGDSLGDIFFNRPARAIEEAKKQRMEAEVLNQFNKSRGGGLVSMPGGVLGEIVGNPQGMIDGQNLAFNPLNVVKQAGEKFQNFLNRPVMPDNINPTTGRDFNFEALPPEQQQMFIDAMRQGR